jgi:anti-sigma regulatory factor (Ser/Thr protein kinase)
MTKTLGIRDIEHYHWQVAEADSPFSWSGNGSSLSLAAAIELACIEAPRKAGKMSLPAPAVTITNCPIWSLVKEARWPDRRTGKAKLRNGSIVVVVLPSDANDPWWTQNLHNLRNELTAHGFPINLALGLTGAVIEMADNVWLHSDAAQPGVLAYQVRRRKFAFSVADTGIGILTSLKKNPDYQSLSSSMDAIRKAIQPGVTRFDHGGLGFTQLINALADLWGSVRVRSGEAAVIIDRTSETRKKDFVYLPHLPGAHISVRCSMDAPTERLA